MNANAVLTWMELVAWAIFGVALVFLCFFLEG